MTKTDRRRRALAIAVLLGFVACIAAQAEGPREVGFVEQTSGAPEDYRWERGEAVLSVRVFAPVQAGDRIRVLTPGQELRLRIGAESRRVTPADGVVEIDAGAEAVTVATNVAVWLGDWLSGDTAPEAQRVSLTARGLDLLAPILEGAEPHLLAGSAPFTLTWQGGHPPYAVTLAGEAEGAPVHRWDSLPDARCEHPALLLAPGRYRLTIRDAAGAEVSQILHAVTEVPTPPALGEPGDPITRALEAGWLAGRDDGRWRLEAYRRIADLCERVPAARLLCRGLEVGGPIPVPPDPS